MTADELALVSAAAGFCVADLYLDESNPPARCDISEEFFLADTADAAPFPAIGPFGQAQQIASAGTSRHSVTDSGSECGEITWSKGTMTPFETVAHNRVTPCFTPNTRIETTEGPIAVGELVPGDRVLTRDNGYRTLRWVGRRDLNRTDLALAPDLQPVLIRRGALGNDMPVVDMSVSPQHRVLLTGARAELMFGEGEVLAAAVDLVGAPGIERLTVDEITYIHVMFDSHEVILSDGAWTESFQPAQDTLDGLLDAQRMELLTLFPELARIDADTQVTFAARRTLDRYEALALMAA